MRIGIASTSDPRSALIRDFCKMLTDLAPQVHVVAMDPIEELFPYLRIHPRIKYRGVPKARELPLILEMIKGGFAKDIGDADMLSKMGMPAKAKVYITPACPYCPGIVSALSKAAHGEAKIDLEIIDGEMFGELSRQDQIRSVPTVIMDDQFRWTGSIRISEIMDMAIRRDPGRASAQTLRGIIEAGDAQLLARMMVRSNQVYPAFIELLAHSQWLVRLGAMAVLEYLDEVGPDLAEQARAAVWERFESADDSVKGDIAYMLGSAKHPMVPSFLAAVIAGNYAPAVRDAAREALENIQKPLQH